MANDSPQVENKTDKPSNKTSDEDKKFSDQSQQVVEQSGEKNVLNKYRSVTYNFTLAALKKNYLEKPEELRNSELDFVILSSGGKGMNAMKVGSTINTSSQAAAARSDFASRDPRRLDISDEKKAEPMRNFGEELVGEFNKKSPGRFDMFIDNVEIESLMAFTESANTSLPTKIKFEVIEPYSVNGFIEALYVGALSAGYTNYIHASFLLKVEFKGYPDDQEFPEPVVIPNSVRYFPIGLTNITVDITEKGTKYVVDAIPYNERAFGTPSVVKKPIKMEGQTNKEILKSFLDNVYKQAVQSWKDSDKAGNANQVDQYDIKFPSWSDTDGWVETSDNNIAGAKLVEIHQDNALYKLVDPATASKPTAYKANGTSQPSPDQQAKQPEGIKYEPTKTVVQFPEGMGVHDVITAVIRDSEYIRDILKDIKKHTDSYGMVDYFMIRIETTNTDQVNDATKKPVQKLTFVVTPYKVHYTKIPNLADNLIDEKELKKLSLREYNYIYTGQNVDVMDFKLNFNTLFFEAVPAGLGNKDIPQSRTAAGNSNNVDVSQKSPDAETASRMQVPLHPKAPAPTPTQAYSGNASQPLDDPYSLLARGMHNAVVNSKASMITGEITILGDPFYLVTGGLGNYNPKPEGRGKYADGQANQNYGQMMITVNFRNPVDIMPLEAGGMMYFDSERVPFSGVYMVTQVNHTFRDGIFKQRLNIIRMPGQILDYSVKPTDPSNSIIPKPNAADQIVPDATRAMSPSQRLDSDTAYTQLDRGLPSPGLPGAASNFTGASGGLGGTSPALMNRTYGLVSRSGGLAPTSSVIGSPLPTDPRSNIRLNSSSLGRLSQSNLGSAALLAVAANVVTGNLPAKRAAGVLAGAVIGGAIATALKRPNPGSGIGAGSTLSISSTPPSSTTANDVRSGAQYDSATLPASSISSVAGSSITAQTVGTVAALGASASALVGGVGSKIQSLLGSKADPGAIAAQAGINPAALSGLSSNLTSKIPGQISGLAGSAPSDVNLTQAANNGLVVGYIPANKMQNVPATTPYRTAPVPATDVAYTQQVVQRGGRPALENLYGVNNVNSISSNVVAPETIAAASTAIPASQSNPLASANRLLNSVDAKVATDKLNSAQSLMSKVTGSALVADINSIGSAASKFGSKIAGSSPLDKLINRNG